MLVVSESVPNWSCTLTVVSVDATSRAALSTVVVERVLDLLTTIVILALLGLTAGQALQEAEAGSPAPEPEMGELEAAAGESLEDSRQHPSPPDRQVEERLPAFSEDGRDLAIDLVQREDVRAAKLEPMTLRICTFYARLIPVQASIPRTGSFISRRLFPSARRAQSSRHRAIRLRIPARTCR